MKRIIALFLSLILLLSLFAACGRKEPDRSYEKIAHEYPMGWWPVTIDDTQEPLYTFPPVTCYDDVVLYAKQYYYMTYGITNNNPYVVIRDSEAGAWLYVSSVLSFEDLGYPGIPMITPTNFENYRFVITDSGDVLECRTWSYDLESVDFIVNYELLEEKLDYEGVDFDLSNCFDFSYDDIKDFESHDMFIEKLEPVTCAQDVVERAEYLRRRSYGTEDLNPYAVCYDSVNDCWLYYELISTYQTSMYFVIDSSGQLLLFTFYIPKLS